MTDLRFLLCLAASAVMLTACTADPIGTTFGGLGESASSTGDSQSGSTESGPDSNSNSASTSETTPATSSDSEDSTTEDSTTDDGTTGATTDDPTGGSTTASGTTTTGDESGSSSSSSTGGPPGVHQLYQGVFNGTEYEYGFNNAIQILDITGGPADTDWSRWAMLHDAGAFRLYFMQQGADDTIYQFVYNAATQDYEFGFNSAVEELGITGIPVDADMSSFAMLYGQDAYRLYAQSTSDPLSIHQFAYNAATQNYEYGFDNAIPQIDVTMFPAAADASGWGMLWENDNYRFYTFANAAHDAVAQGAYNSASGDYEYGFSSIPEIDIVGFPADTNTDDFGLLHDGDEFRLYMLRQ